MNRHALSGMPSLVNRPVGVHDVAPRRSGRLRFLARVRWQLVGAVLLCIVLPLVLRQQYGVFTLPMRIGSAETALAGTTFALLFGAYVLRKIGALPGGAERCVCPANLRCHLWAGGGVLLLPANRLLRGSSSPRASSLPLSGTCSWSASNAVISGRSWSSSPLVMLSPCLGLRKRIGASQKPSDIPVGSSGVVADLRADLDPEWERFLATCALKGLPVYHSKQVSESLTGRVEIEHLSENSLGSLLPSSIYLRSSVSSIWLGCWYACRLLRTRRCRQRFSSGGRMAGRSSSGRSGWDIAARFSRSSSSAPCAQDVGRQGFHRARRSARYPDRPFLRKMRIDELPQIFNILRGEMSWIGPRPESLPLSEWYESKIPFYSYRHIVRPGITGWAQVQQGYAPQVKAVTDKLTYDFFYIKNFSPWLDLLIVARTIRTVLTGFGAR